MFKKEAGDWKRYRALSPTEVDFHNSEVGRRENPYESAMSDVHDKALEALKAAQQQGHAHVLFTHGSSTSRIGKTTARSVVRNLMKSKDATPYIVRGNCIQHESVFLAAIRPLPAPELTLALAQVGGERSH